MRDDLNYQWNRPVLSSALPGKWCSQYLRKLGSIYYPFWVDCLSLFMQLFFIEGWLTDPHSRRTAVLFSVADLYRNTRWIALVIQDPAASVARGTWEEASKGYVSHKEGFQGSSSIAGLTITGSYFKPLLFMLTSWLLFTVFAVCIDVLVPESLVGEVNIYELNIGSYFS